MKVGFLLPHDEVHHVAHMFPVARQLAVDHPDSAVIVMTSSVRSGDTVDRFITAERPTRLLHIRLEGRSYGQDILPLFNCLVVSDPKTANALQVRRLSRCPVIGMVIGASDHGLTHWSEWDGADHILVQGNKSFDRLTNAGQFEPSHVSVVGCAKLDTPIHHPTSASAFNGRKIVLYNPHHDPRVSSWFRWGPDILDWFVDNDDYHLIFAPHVRLFDRAFARPQGTMRLHRVGRIQERWHNASNINIDLGSTASLGRDYTARADIYLGDAGAQLYEFLERPRPCAFLNAQDVSIKRVDHRHSNWGAGHMISDIALLGGVLETTQEWHAEAYRPMQEKMFAYSLSVTEQPAARRASDAITRFLASA